MSTSTSDRAGHAAWIRLRLVDARGCAGFTLMELLLGLCLSLCIVLGVAPLWVSFQSLGMREGDETVWALQGRVAAARFERDLRLSGLGTCPFATAATVLQATAAQVVLLVTTSDSAAPLLVEWELVNDSLMRRWGTCPSVCPSTFSHSLYSDNKTMLENVDMSHSRLSYKVAGTAAGLPLATADLPLVDSVTIELAGLPVATASGAVVSACGTIGR